MAFSFFGGIHPKENKSYACNQPIREFPEPDVLAGDIVENLQSALESFQGLMGMLGE